MAVQDFQWIYYLLVFMIGFFAGRIAMAVQVAAMKDSSKLKKKG